MTEEVRREIARASQLEPYAGFEQAYVCLVKLSLDESEPDEFARIRAMVSRLPDATASKILALPEVDQLLNLNPPIETFFVHEREELRSIETAEAVDTIRTRRSSNPRKALKSLTFILKNIRNKRDHGFKSPEGPRDREILGAAHLIAVRIAEQCVVHQQGLKVAR